MTTVLVCGDRHLGERDYDYWRGFVFSTLDDVADHWGCDLIIEGCAKGADRLAGWPCPAMIKRTYSNPAKALPGWAHERGIPVDHHPADWRRHGGCSCDPRTPHYATKCNFAGIRRNREMLYEGKPDLVVAFHPTLATSRGTLDMVTLARKEGVPTFVFPHH